MHIGHDRVDEIVYLPEQFPVMALDATKGTPLISRATADIVVDDGYWPLSLADARGGSTINSFAQGDRDIFKLGDINAIRFAFKVPALPTGHNAHITFGIGSASNNNPASVATRLLLHIKPDGKGYLEWDDGVTAVVDQLAGDIRADTDLDLVFDFAGAVPEFAGVNVDPTPDVLVSLTKRFSNKGFRKSVDPVHLTKKINLSAAKDTYVQLMGSIYNATVNGGAAGSGAAAAGKVLLRRIDIVRKQLD